MVAAIGYLSLWVVFFTQSTFWHGTRKGKWSFGGSVKRSVASSMQFVVVSQDCIRHASVDE